MRRYYKRSYNSGELTWLSVIEVGLVIIFLCVSIYRPLNKASDMREVTVTVTDKAVKNSGDDGKYLVFAEDAKGNVATFEVTDSWVAGRFNSSDVYAAIKVGNTYIFTIGGSRNELMSWYPNIYEYELIEK